ncbi:MAG: CRTAC1 family protein [Verrucomicrobiota bacterium]|nr:CRTAC1 family protein [Verrucomicrobiota bacterium]
MKCTIIYAAPGSFLLSMLLVLSLSTASQGADERSEKKTEPLSAYPFAFRDAAEEAGLLPPLAGIRAHGAAWGDIDGNGWPDLYVANFHSRGQANMLVRNSDGKFLLDGQEHLRLSGMGSGALFVDLANSGRLDLYVSNCAHGKAGAQATPSALFRNDGGGRFTDVSGESNACPSGYAGRGVAALDFDGDGLLDLLTCEQYYSPEVKTGPALYRNRGNHRFENVALAAGLPAGLGGLGATAADLNNDGWPDVFLVSGAGDHRLLINDGRGKFREPPGVRAVFRWKDLDANDPPAGVCIADVNRDDLPDVVIGHHSQRPWVTPAPIRLYLHRGVKDGIPAFEEVTQAAGLRPLLMKAPHVEIQDFDNDGWPDIFASIVKFKDGKSYPLIYKNLGLENRMARFREDAWPINDFPTAEDKGVKRSGPLFDKILQEKKIIYFAAGPSGDYNRDGKLDLFLANWWMESPSLLLRNETPGGNWLQVQMQCTGGVNRMGIGSRIRVYRAGKLGEAPALLGSREISIGYGYCSGQEAFVHFGLGNQATVDVEVTLPHGKGRIVRKGVQASRRLTIEP